MVRFARFLPDLTQPDNKPMSTHETTVGKWLTQGLLSVALVLTAGYAMAASPERENDPFEKTNRNILEFNLDVDRAILKPVAKPWREIVPAPVRNGVGNFFSNLGEPMTIANGLLQGKAGQAGGDLLRFLLNTTIGVLGIFDVAGALNLPKHKEDFGQTLAVWGVPAGPYLMLPFLGPSSLRDAAGLIPEFAYGDAVGYLDSPDRLYASGLRLVDTRSRLLDTDELLAMQPDPYLFLRESWRQSRANLIHDGNPPGSQDEWSEDELIDQLLQDDQ